ncbi:hypothetical protein AAMO2058_001397500 [Amorphochlora amoebiformis]
MPSIHHHPTFIITILPYPTFIHYHHFPIPNITQHSSSPNIHHHHLTYKTFIINILHTQHSIITILHTQHSSSTSQIPNIHHHHLTYPTFIITILHTQHSSSPSYIPNIHHHHLTYPTFIITTVSSQHSSSPLSHSQHSSSPLSHSQHSSSPLSLANIHHHHCFIVNIHHHFPMPNIHHHFPIAEPIVMSLSIKDLLALSTKINLSKTCSVLSVPVAPKMPLTPFKPVMNPRPRRRTTKSMLHPTKPLNTCEGYSMIYPTPHALPTTWKGRLEIIPPLVKDCNNDFLKYASEIELLICKLQAHGDNSLLAGLDVQEYDSIMAVPENKEDISLKETVSRIAAYLRRKEDHKSEYARSDITASLHDKVRQCHHCAKKGHTKRTCWELHGKPGATNQGEHEDSNAAGLVDSDDDYNW